MSCQPKRFMSPREAALEWGLSLQVVYRMCRDGSLPVRKVGNAWVIDMAQAGKPDEPYVPESWQLRDLDD